MEMRAIEDIGIGQDLTPPLRPLAAVLRDSALSSHCSACLSTLPAEPPSDTPITPTTLYCSPSCSTCDSPLHLSSGEAHLLKSPPSTWDDDSGDLRLSLRLFSIFQKLPPKEGAFPRSPAPITGDQKLLFGGEKNCPLKQIENAQGPDDCVEDNELPREGMGLRYQNDAVFERIAGLMTNREKVAFGQNRNNPDENYQNILEGAKLIAKARSLCLDEDTNVEQQDDDFALEEIMLCLVLTNAVEVQDKSGCSIGVAVYDTAFSWINHSCSPNACYRFLVGQEDSEHLPLRITSKARNGCDVQIQCEVEKNGYGPRVVVRSIKDVKMGEEVTIAYTDLLQPKEMRRAELWSKYRFNCNCRRCNGVTGTYVDDALQGPVSATYLDEMTKSFEDAVTDYLSSDDPISCCNNLENLLTQCHIIQPKPPQKTKVKLKPFQYLSLNAYTTLASAYRVRANDLLTLNYDNKRRNLEAFNMQKTGTAYSLLLAGGAHHLFMSESALITTVANFWINAGESMLNLARSSWWEQFPMDLTSSLLTQKCDNCDVLEVKSVGQRRVYNCIADITPKVWSLLASESGFLREIRNPIDFSWLTYQESCLITETQGSDGRESDEEVRMNLVLLGGHCLRYGELLSSVCYGLSGETKYLLQGSCDFK